MDGMIHIPAPDWRWQAPLASARAPHGDHPDPGVRRAWRYLRRRQQDPQHLEQDMPALAAAHALHADLRPLAELVECRILAGQPAEVIADRSGIELAALREYEEVFFAVRPHLQQPDYINQVIAQSSATDYEKERKALAYQGGSAIIDELLGTTPVLAAAQPGRLVDVSRPWNLWRLLLELDLTAVEADAGPDDYDWHQDLHRRPGPDQRKAALAGLAAVNPAEAKYLDSLRHMLSALDWRVGRVRPSRHPIIAYYDRTGVELRAHQLTALSWGLVPNDLPPMLEFPLRSPSCSAVIEPPKPPTELPGPLDAPALPPSSPAMAEPPKPPSADAAEPIPYVEEAPQPIPDEEKPRRRRSR